MGAVAVVLLYDGCNGSDHKKALQNAGPSALYPIHGHRQLPGQLHPLFVFLFFGTLALFFPPKAGFASTFDLFAGGLSGNCLFFSCGALGLLFPPKAGFVGTSFGLNGNGPFFVFFGVLIGAACFAVPPHSHCVQKFRAIIACTALREMATAKAKNTNSVVSEIRRPP